MLVAWWSRVLPEHRDCVVARKLEATPEGLHGPPSAGTRVSPPTASDPSVPLLGSDVNTHRDIYYCGGEASPTSVFLC